MNPTGRRGPRALRRGARAGAGALLALAASANAGALAAQAAPADPGAGLPPPSPTSAFGAPAQTIHADLDGDGIYEDLERRMERAEPDERLSAIVSLRGSAPGGATERLAEGFGFETKRRFTIIDAFVAKLSSRQILGLAGSPHVRQIEPNARVWPLNDGAQASTGVTQGRLDYPGLDGNGDGDPDSYSPDDLVAAVIDTGIDASHEDLDGGKVIAFKDFVNGQEEPYDDDALGHGTHVAATIAGAGEASDGLYRGAAPAAGLVGVKVIPGGGAATTEDAIAGIEWVADHREEYGIEVMNLSLGGVGCSSGTEAVSSAVNAAAQAGILPVAGAGNSGPATCTVGSIAAAADALTVGAVRDSSEKGFALADFSSRGPTADGRIKPDVVAPGVDITSAAAATVDGYSTKSGTSMSSPFAAGVALLMLDANPDLTPAELKQKLMLTAVDMGRGGDNLTPGTSGPDVDYGAGRIDAYAAIAAAGAPLDSPPDAPAHELIEGELTQSGEVATHEIEVTSARFPLALAAIAPAFEPLARPTLSTPAVWPPLDPLELSLRSPSGALVAQGDAEGRQETLLYQPSQAGTYTLEVSSDLDTVDYFIDVSYGELGTEVTSAPPGLTNSAAASFEFRSLGPGAAFECRLDSVAEADFSPCSSPHNYSDLGEGAHVFEVRAIDADGNRGTSATHSWTIDLTAPQTTIQAAPPALTDSTSAELSFAADDTETTFECRLDSTAEADFAPCSSPKQYSGLAEGEHSFSVRATDAAGNVEQPPPTHSWTVDLTAPRTTIGEAPPAVTNSTTVELSFTSDEPDASFECRLDSDAEADFDPCASPVTYADLAEGEHTFSVRATDPAGNTEEPPRNHSWAIDLTPPETTIEGGPPATTGSTASFEFSSSEPGSVFECALDGAVPEPCSSPWQYAGLGEGSRSFEVAATDAAGNRDPSPAGHTWTVHSEPVSDPGGGGSGTGIWGGPLPGAGPAPTLGGQTTTKSKKRRRCKRKKAKRRAARTSKRRGCRPRCKRKAKRRASDRAASASKRRGCRRKGS